MNYEEVCLPGFSLSFSVTFRSMCSYLCRSILNKRVTALGGYHCGQLRTSTMVWYCIVLAHGSGRSAFQSAAQKKERNLEKKKCGGGERRKIKEEGLLTLSVFCPIRITCCQRIALLSFTNPSPAI